MSETADLQAVRRYFALTQAALAQWLGVSRVRLAQAESKASRPLPLRAAAQLTQLTLAMAAALPAPPAGPPLLAPLQARLAECRYQVARLTEQLAQMQARARPFGQRLAAVPDLLAALPPGPEANLRRRWLQRLADEATDALAADCGPLPQALLAARRAAWQHEADLLAPLVPDNG